MARKDADTAHPPVSAAAPAGRGGCVSVFDTDPPRASAVDLAHAGVADMSRIAQQIRHAERERALAVPATHQHGTIATRQLLALGFTRAAIARRVAQGRLHKLRDGIYAVGHTRLSPDGHRWAAVLAGGDGAVASHQTAAEQWDVRSLRGGAQHITVLPGNGSRSRRGLRVHRTKLTEDDVTERNGLRVTTLARTLVDLGDVVRAEQVRRAFIRAEQLRLIDMQEIEGALERAGRRRGAAILRGLLRAYDPRWQATRSGLEVRMLDIVRDHALPQPEVNAWIAGRWEADLLWSAERLVVEVDGGVVHGTVSARSRDAARDRALRRLGYRVLRVAERDLEAPDRVARRVRNAVERGGSVAVIDTDPPRCG